MQEASEPRGKNSSDISNVLQKSKASPAGWCLGAGSVLVAIASQSPPIAGICFCFLVFIGLLVWGLQKVEHIIAGRRELEARMTEAQFSNEAHIRDHEFRMRKLEAEEKAKSSDIEVRKIEVTAVAVCNEVMARGKAFTIGNGLVPPDDLSNVKVFQ